MEDVVTFPGRMYAFVNFRHSDDARAAAIALHDREVAPLTGSRRLVIKYRGSKKAMGRINDVMAEGLVDPAVAQVGLFLVTEQLMSLQESCWASIIHPYLDSARFVEPGNASITKD